MDKSAKVLMAETLALTSDRMFVEIRYKSLYMETYKVKQNISPPIKLFTSAEIFICVQRNNKILTWYGRRHDTFFANRPLTGVTITFIRFVTVALISDRTFVEIKHKSLYMETHMVKQIISQPIKLLTLAEIFICKSRNNKILTWYDQI